MNHKPTTICTITKIGIIAGLVTMPNASFAHGTMLIPQSRIYQCRFNDNPERPQNPACRAAIQASGNQMLYDWNGVNQPNAAGNSRKRIPDGQLCSGGKANFRGMDLPRKDWGSTAIRNGRFVFQFYPTAPHATKDITLYITRTGWNPVTPLRWGDLVEFCRQGPVPLTNGAQGKNVYKINCTIPARTGRHVIYSVWQRSDSLEAFYACNDVQFVKGNPGFKRIGGINNAQNLPVGTQLSFRIFNKNGADVETTKLTLAPGQGGKATWPYVLGLAVNKKSLFARVGVLGVNGKIVPTKQLNGNSVYMASKLNLSFVIDKEIPAR